MNQLFPPGLREYLLPCLLVTLWWLFLRPVCPDELFWYEFLPGDCDWRRVLLGQNLPPGDLKNLLLEPFLCWLPRWEEDRLLPRWEENCPLPLELRFLPRWNSAAWMNSCSVLVAVTRLVSNLQQCSGRYIVAWIWSDVTVLSCLWTSWQTKITFSFSPLVSFNCM